MSDGRNLYSREDIEAVDSKADIRDQLPDLKGRGASLYCKCPKCGKEGKQKGLMVTHKKEAGRVKNIAKCFSCGFSVVGPINARMKILGEDFVTALQACAASAGITLYSRKEKKDLRESKVKDSFLIKQLKGSGLTLDDVKVRVPIPGSEDYRIEYAFRKGGVDSNFNVNDSDDEMLIYYYGLDGTPMLYAKKGAAGQRRPYVRVRWSNPAAHLDSQGKEIKYQTPRGAPCQFYIPETIRECFRNKTHIETLVIQEGEKKAEKACKHGIMSLGIQGIYNIGTAESGLMKEIQYIVDKCSVRNIVLLFDSDWDNLHRRPQNGDRIDQRPNQFSKAVMKFRDYVQTLHGLGLMVDIWFGHVNKNERNDKGIDDILSNTLFKNPGILAEDMKAAMLDINGHGQYLDIHKITTFTDLKIKDLWLLNNRQKFFDKYSKVISGLQRFIFSGITFVVDDGEIREAFKGATAQFWNVDDNDDKGKKSVDFSQHLAIEFLAANNFRRVFSDDLPIGQYRLARIDSGIISEVAGCDIREFVMNYIVQSTTERTVLDHFASRMSSYFGADRLELLPKVKDTFHFFDQDIDKVHFRNGECTISAHEIRLEPISSFVWEQNIMPHKFRRVPVLNLVRNADGSFLPELTEEGWKCDFAKFLFNTSNFWKNKAATEDDHREYYAHFVNKVTAIGYLLCSWKNPAEKLAVVAMDSKMDAVAISNGRSGKSMIHQAVRKIRPTVVIDGKKYDANFAFSLVDMQTRIIAFDDVKVNFDFQSLYSTMTDDLIVNVKGGAMFKIPFERAPKFYISTNHAINDTSDSGEDRRQYMAFSDYYTKDFSPFDDFGHYFFDDWDEDQWNLFYNLMLECIMYYRRSVVEGWTRKGRGIVPPPMANLRLRQYRQTMGEAFYLWADEYFDPAGLALNNKLRRKQIVDEFHKEYPERTEQIRPNQFLQKLRAFCRFKGYHLNPNARNDKGKTFHDWKANHAPDETSFIGTSYKTGSVEYFLVATDEFASRMQT